MNAPDTAALDTAADNTSHQFGWQARLALRIENRNGRSALTHRLHHGPLRVQKALYPEGDAVCQLLLLHPPAGIAGGDQLSINIEVLAGAHAQITTPGAGKWYRSKGPTATQTIALHVAADAALEWLPQEVIVFDQAKAIASTIITLEENARAIGWDIVCLGRRASGETFDTGSFRQSLRLQRADGYPLWQESMHLHGADASLHATVGLGGASVFGVMWIAGCKPDPALTEALRGLPIQDGVCAVSALPDVTLVRAVANCAENLRACFEAAWAIARPTLMQRVAIPPRIWRT
jgi:urease accessory protein